MTFSTEFLCVQHEEAPGVFCPHLTTVAPQDFVQKKKKEIKGKKKKKKKRTQGRRVVLLSAMHITAGGCLRENDWGELLIHDFQLWLGKSWRLQVCYQHHQDGEETRRMHTLKRNIMGIRCAADFPLLPAPRFSVRGSRCLSEFDGQRRGEKRHREVMGE
jgi:hypothetical protein